MAPPPSPYMATSRAYSATSKKRESEKKREKKRETIIIAACPARVDHARDLAAGTRRRTVRSDFTLRMIDGNISETLHFEVIVIM